jgi:hypothetical protein
MQLFDTSGRAVPHGAPAYQGRLSRRSRGADCCAEWCQGTKSRASPIVGVETAPFIDPPSPHKTICVAGLRPVLNIVFRSLRGSRSPEPPGWGASVPQTPRGGFGRRQPPNPGGLGGGSPPERKTISYYFSWPKARYVCDFLDVIPEHPSEQHPISHRIPCEPWFGRERGKHGRLRGKIRGRS